MTSKPRARRAKAVIVAFISGLSGKAKNSAKMPTMPNSCTPAPAGVIGTNPSAVTSGWIRKNASQVKAGLKPRTNQEP